MTRHYVDTRLGQLHVVSEGEGPTLVLLGPAGRSASVFSGLIPLLSRRMRILAPDMPGSGRSDPLPVDATIESLAGCVVDLLDAFGCASSHLYGLHTGNKIGAALAVRWPARVQSLVLCGQSHSIIPSNAERNRVIGGRVQEYFEEKGDIEPRVQALRSWAKLHRRANSLWWSDELLDAADATAAVKHAKQLVLDEMLSFDSTAPLYSMNFDYDFESDLQRIRVRTLVIEVATPEEDVRVGRQGAKVQALIPDARLAIMQARGFRLTLEDRADELAALLMDFLAADPAGATTRV